jgi:AraC-like DNA-binding protein
MCLAIVAPPPARGLNETASSRARVEPRGGGCHSQAMALSPELAAWTSFVDEVRVAVPPLARIDRLPDGTTGLLFRMLDDGRGDLVVLGPRTRALYKRAPAFVLGLHVRFRPGGAARFLGVPLDSLTDGVVPVRDVWGGRADRLLDDLLALGVDTGPRRMAARRAAIAQALAERGREDREPAGAALARAAVRRLDADAADSPIRELAAELGTSSRTLRRVFAAAVGLSPKRYALIARFRRAMTQVDRGRGRWAEVAAAAGYADQAHLIGDFRALAGLSPAALARGDAADSLRQVCAG